MYQVVSLGSFILLSFADPFQSENQQRLFLVPSLLILFFYFLSSLIAGLSFSFSLFHFFLSFFNSLIHEFCLYLFPLCYLGFPCGSAGKESTCNAGDLGSIPGLGRSSGEGKGYPLQYSGLENSMDYTVHGVSKSQTRLSGFRFHFHELVGDHGILISFFHSTHC